MKKNGFTVVELISSFALTMIISLFLFEVLIDVKDIFIETSIKTSIQEKLGIISKNIKSTVKTYGSNAKNKIEIGTDNIITVNNQKFNLPADVTIKNKDISENCSNSECYIKVSFTLENPNLKKPYEYNAVYYYIK